jgi:hypothetical protein
VGEEIKSKEKELKKKKNRTINVSNAPNKFPIRLIQYSTQKKNSPAQTNEAITKEKRKGFMVPPARASQLLFKFPLQDSSTPSQSKVPKRKRKKRIYSRRNS